MDVLQETRSKDHENESCCPVQDASYFRRLHKETVRNLETSYSKWMDIKTKTDEIPEPVIGEIDSVTGQAKLLISQKLSQFESLIDEHEFDRGDKPINLTDLQGFWDMIFFQVEDIDRKVANLETMSQNGWKKIDDMKTPNVVSKTRQKRYVKSSPMSARSVPNRSRSMVRRYIRDAQRQLAQTSQNSAGNNDLVCLDSRSRSRSPIKSPVMSLVKAVERTNERTTTDEEDS